MIKQNFTTQNLSAYDKIEGLVNNIHPGTFRVENYRDGSYDPYWKSKIKGGQNATTPLKAYATSCSYSPGSCMYNLAGWSGQGEDTDFGLNIYIPQVISFAAGVNGFRLPDPSLINEAQAKARGNAFGKVHDLQSAFQGQIFLGELRETVAFLKSPFEASVKLIEKTTKLRKAIIADKRNVTISQSRRQADKQLANALGDSWLEFQFGILPLISDIQTIIDVINDLHKTQKASYRYYGKAESGVIGPLTVTGENVVYDCDSRIEDTAECIVHFGVLSERIHTASLASDRLIHSISSLSEIPSTAWELTPWSFLVDYFVNVGSIIQATTTGTQIVSYSSESNIYTQKNSYTILRVNRPSADYILNPSISRPRSMSFQHRSVDRVGGSLAIPPLTINLPGSKIRYANIAALLTKFLK